MLHIFRTSVTVYISVPMFSCHSVIPISQVRASAVLLRTVGMCKYKKLWTIRGNGEEEGRG